MVINSGYRWFFAVFERKMSARYEISFLVVLLPAIFEKIIYTMEALDD